MDWYTEDGDALSARRRSMWGPNIVTDIPLEPAREIAAIAEMIADVPESMVELVEMSEVVDMAFVGGISGHIPSQPH